MTEIVCVTGTRADFGRMRSTLRQIERHPSLNVALIVTGMHLSKDFGNTIKEIEKEGFNIIHKVDTLPLYDTGAAMAKALAKCIDGFSEILERREFDIILVLGDRGEMLAASIVGAHMNIPVAHIGGGYISGSIDNRLRHAITLFSDIHFVANSNCADFVISLKAKRSNVYVVGAPDLDFIVNEEFARPETVAKKFNLDLSRSIVLVSQHPVTTEVEDAGRQMKETMEAVIKMGMQTIVVYPNADAGGRKMIRVLREYQDYSFIQVYKNISYELYLGLMNVANVLVGNSSSGIIEAPSFQLPAVNIGTRQESREKALNVIDVGYDQKKIDEAMKKALTDDFIKLSKSCKNPYGSGRTGEKIAEILSQLSFVDLKARNHDKSYHI